MRLNQNNNGQNTCGNASGQPFRVLHPDGYIDVSGAPVFYYHIKDHLGNVRAVIQASPGSTSGTLVQATDYYPFGMAYTTDFSLHRHENQLQMLRIDGRAVEDDSPTLTRNNPYLYNGKEEQPMPGKWLDYGFRFYDPQLARFHTVDPLAENYLSHNPYCYVGNNPIKRVDPDGRYWDTDEDKRKAEKIQNNLRNIDKSLSKKQERLNKKIDKVKSNDKLSDSKKQSRLETYNKRNDRIQETRSEVQSAINEIGAMGDVDNIAFTFNDLGSENSYGYISHDAKENGHLRITINHTGDFGNILHEMMHGYQVTTGMLKPVSHEPALFYQPQNKAHEVEAYRRQYRITGTHPKSLQYPVIQNARQINSLYIRTIYYIGKDGKPVYPYL